MNLANKIHLRPEEEVLEIVRRYGLTYFWRYFFGLLIMLATSFFMFWMFSRGWWGRSLYGFGMFLGLFIIFRAWYFSKHNFLAITNERVVDICRLGWFDEIISSVGYGDIKDVYFRKKGIFANIFNYGSLFVETKSQKMVLEADRVKAPQKLLALITETSENFRRGKHLVGKQALYSGFLKIINELSEEEVCEIKDLLENRLQIFDELAEDGDEEV